jgi:hypothetical protein
MNRLELQWATQTFDDRPVDYLDFVIDGQSVIDWIRWLEDREPPIGKVTLFTRGYSARAIRAARRQLLAREPSPEGVPLYVCPCRNLDCGSVLAVVKRAGDAIIWEALLSRGAIPGASPPFENVPAFAFELGSYRAALASSEAIG